MSKKPSIYASDRPLQPLKFPRRARWVCERLAGGETLESICASPGMPSQPTVYRWLQQCAEFKRRYALARRVQAERWIDQVVDIADSLGDGALEADLRRGRLRIDARKWAVAQLAEEAADSPSTTPTPLKVRYVGANGES